MTFKTTFKQRLFRTILLALIGFAIGGVIAAVSFFDYEIDKNDDAATPRTIVATSIGGSFFLVDQDGQPRTEKDYADYYKLIYFGFTYCPAICPTELSKMTEAYLALPAEMQTKIRPVFITVDPERDTPEVMKGYVSLFMPQLIGLSGTSEQVEVAKKAFKVYAAKVPEGDDGDYTMDHSSLIYFMAPNGDTLALFKTVDTDQDMSARIISILKQ